MAAVPDHSGPFASREGCPQCRADGAGRGADGVCGGMGSQARSAVDDAREFQPAAIEGAQAIGARCPQAESSSRCRRASAVATRDLVSPLRRYNATGMRVLFSASYLEDGNFYAASRAEPSAVRRARIGAKSAAAASKVDQLQGVYRRVPFLLRQLQGKLQLPVAAYAAPHQDQAA